MSKAQMKFDRAFRRQQRIRLRKNRQNYHGGAWNEVVKSKWIDTPTPCSCDMCGNPRRKSWGESLTLAELRHLDKFKVSCEDID